MKNNKFILLFSILPLITFVFVLLLFFNFENTMSCVGINTEEIKNIQWTVIKNVSYLLGGLLLIIQILISNRRAVALEKTADATLKSGVEQRYHNATEHLANKNIVIRIGAIYNLYHISQSTDTYDTTIFDMFCAYLRNNKNNVSQKEKQIIIDKLFIVDKDKRVLDNIKSIDLIGADLENINLKKVYLVGANLTDADLTGANLTEANLTKVNLTGANLTEANLTKVNLTGANLTEANLTEANLTKVNLTETVIPYKQNQWQEIRGLRYVKLDGMKFGSGTNMNNLDLTGASFANAIIKHVSFENAILQNADFTGTEGLTFEKLIQTKCLYNIKGIDVNIDKQLSDEKPELFNESKSEIIK